MTWADLHRQMSMRNRQSHSQSTQWQVLTVMMGLSWSELNLWMNEHTHTQGQPGSFYAMSSHAREKHCKPIGVKLSETNRFRSGCWWEPPRRSFIWRSALMIIRCVDCETRSSPHTSTRWRRPDGSMGDFCSRQSVMCQKQCRQWRWLLVQIFGKTMYGPDREREEALSWATYRHICRSGLTSTRLMVLKYTVTCLLVSY